MNEWPTCNTNKMLCMKSKLDRGQKHYKLVQLMSCSKKNSPCTAGIYKVKIKINHHTLKLL